MTHQERQDSPKLTTEEWVGIIKKRWEVIPEYKVDPVAFRHLAVICDGNRRFAKSLGLPSFDGHKLGVEVIKGIMEACRKWDVKHLTFWTWSTENWKREDAQVAVVMNLAAHGLRDPRAINTLFEHKVRFTHFGRKNRLPSEVRVAIEDLELKTQGFSDRFVNLAIDYGGEDEMVRAVVRIIEDAKNGKISSEYFLQNRETLYQYLDTSGQPLPDLVVRTGMSSGEIPHTSGFMPLQTAYSGWVFVPTLFPDLKPEGLLATMQEFIAYEKRVGR